MEQSISSWIAGFALDAARTQMLFNRAYTETAEWPAVLRPPLQFAQEYEISLHLVMGMDRSRGFTVRALPLNLHYSISFQSRVESASSIRISVTQCPVDPGAWPSNKPL